MRKLYEVLVPDTSSLFLYLRSNRVFRSNPSGDPRGILTADVRLLPPSRHHQSFQQPPSEILHRIFQCAYDNEPDNFCWRPHFLSFALVCRAWRAPALDCLYEDLDASCSTDVDLVAVAEAVKRSPAFGAAIRRLDHYLHVPPGHGLFDQNDYQVAKALIDIIQSAPGLQKLLVASIPKSLKAALLQALCSTCQSMGSFWMYAAPPVLDMGDLFSAFGHWKRLHTLNLYEWKSYEDILVCTRFIHSSYSSKTNSMMKPERTPPLACPLIQLSLSKGHITGYQFQNLTAGAHATLTVLELNAIDGLTNDTFKSALLLLAPTLERIDISDCQIICVERGEALALDAAAPLMRNVAHLSVTAAELVTDKVLRRPLNLEGKVDGSLMLYGDGITLNGLKKMLESDRYGWQDLRVQLDTVVEGKESDSDAEALAACVQALAEERGVKLYLVLGSQ